MRLSISTLKTFFCLIFLARILYFYLYGVGGGTYLAVNLVPISIIIALLDYYERNDSLYKRLGKSTNLIILTIYIILSLIVSIYITFEFESLYLYRAGSFTTLDLIIGTALFIMFMEISRKFQFVLFVFNVFLILYALFGNYIPVDVLWHPGISLTRVVTVNTVELFSGIYGSYTQIAFTLIGPLMLLISILMGFRVHEVLITTLTKVFSRSRILTPYAAMLGSASYGMASVDAVGNATLVGNYTIPLLKRVGFKPEYAAGIECASSVGDLIIPPIMGLTAFVMAELLDVSYWEVAYRGAFLALIYYGTLALSIYLLTIKHLRVAIRSNDNRIGSSLVVERLSINEILITILFFVLILPVLTYLLAAGYTTISAALITSLIAFIIFSGVYFFTYRRDLRNSLTGYIQCLKVATINFCVFISSLVILLGTLSIMVALFTTPGFTSRIGAMVYRLAEQSLALTIIAAFIFGWLVGLGVPVTPVYMMVVLTVGIPLIGVGINPWIVHFFAFLLGIFSEFSPPTSLTAAITSKIAEASFIKTMNNALKLCSPLILLMFSIFIKGSFLIEPGTLESYIHLATTFIACIGVSVASFAEFHENKIIDLPIRVILFIIASLTALHPEPWVYLTTSASTIVFTFIGLRCMRAIYERTI
jgi:TRAP transporter 4TM/12TM fusion protein